MWFIQSPKHQYDMHWNMKLKIKPKDITKCSVKNNEDIMLA